jgi:hypothetical protein
VSVVELIKMSAKQELEKLRNMRAELEQESRSLGEQQCSLENTVISLEEKIIIEELKIEKAAIEELKNRNKTAKEAIAKLKSKKKKLENKLEDAGYDQEESPPENQEKSPPENQEDASEPEENEAIGEGGVVVTAIDGEAFEEQVGIPAEDSPKQEKRKRRFF